MHNSTLDLFTNPEMPETPEMQHSIDNMADTLWEVMNNHMQNDRQHDAIAVCDEFLVDGRDPLDGEYQFIFIPNFTLN